MYALVHTSQEVYLFQETHIMHVFKEDFYGSELKVVMLGYIRPEKNFSSLGKFRNFIEFCARMLTSMVKVKALFDGLGESVSSLLSLASKLTCAVSSMQSCPCIFPDNPVFKHISNPHTSQFILVHSVSPSSSPFHCCISIMSHSRPVLFSVWPDNSIIHIWKTFLQYMYIYLLGIPTSCFIHFCYLSSKSWKRRNHHSLHPFSYSFPWIWLVIFKFFGKVRKWFLDLLVRSSYIFWIRG